MDDISVATWSQMGLTPDVVRDQIDWETRAPLTEAQKDEVVRRFYEENNPHIAHAPMGAARDTFFDKFHHQVRRLAEDVTNA